MIILAVRRLLINIPFRTLGSETTADAFINGRSKPRDSTLTTPPAPA